MLHPPQREMFNPLNINQLRILPASLWEQGEYVTSYYSQKYALIADQRADQLFTGRRTKLN